MATKQVFNKNRHSAGAETSTVLNTDNLISELQIPLLGISANAQVAGSQLNRGTVRDKKIGQYLKAIEFSSENLSRTIDLILRSHNTENSKLELFMEPVHIGLCLEQAIKKLVPLCKLQAQIFNFNPTPSKSNVIVSADRDYLNLAVYHILEQALRNAASEEVLDVLLKTTKNNALVQIKATGCRTRASVLRRSIRKSLQSSGLSKMKSSGPGVNFSLSASGKLLQLMNGYLDVSQSKSGVNFNINLPISTQSELF